MPDLTLWVALSLSEHIGSKTLRALLAHFDDDPQAILNASAEQLQAVPGIGPKIAQSIQAVDLDKTAEALTDWQDTYGISIATLADPNDRYPVNLRSVDDAPATLFVRGVWQPAYDRAVAVVGTRSPSPEAAEIAHALGRLLAEHGLAVVSGLALGVDTAAHQGALASADGRGIAVLGSGVLSIYPPTNQALAVRCTRQGVVLSEVAPFAPPSSARLVARNRIISGLSQALIVVESSSQGGAMYAARAAYKQGRPIFALDLNATGNRSLLENGAQRITPDLSQCIAQLEKHYA